MQVTRARKPRVYKSVFFTSTFIVALCTILVTSSLSWMSFEDAKRHADESIFLRSAEVTTLIAKQSGGALKFGKIDVFDHLFSDAIEGAHGAALAASIFRADGTELASHGDVASFGDGFSTLIQQAIETGTLVRSPDGYSTIVPVRFGKDNGIVGAVAMRWTADVLKAFYFEEQLAALLAAGFVGLGSLGCAAFFLRMRISRPLVRLRNSMVQVAAEDYDTSVPGLQRGDEVGDIAQTLEQFRHQLKAASAASRDSVFKSAAFEGSAAAMMMVDGEFQIQYLNMACQDLLTDFTEFFRSVNSDFDPTELHGLSIGKFLDPQGTIQALAEDPQSLPLTTDIVANDRRIKLTVSVVTDDQDEPIGWSLELQDVTEARLNRAAIDSIDANQIRINLSVEGTLLFVNSNFSKATEIPEDELCGQQFDKLFQFSETDENTVIDLESVRCGETVSGQFVVPGRAGEVIVEGSLNLAKDTMDRPLRLVFIGSDVTTAQRALEETQKERRAIEKAQTEVVRVLGDVLGRLSDGDLTAQIDTVFTDDYEQLRLDFNEAADKLHRAMLGVVTNADQIEIGAAEISSAAGDLAKRTEHQAAALEETAGALDLMTTNVQSAAEGASQAAELVDATRENANASTEVMRNAQDAMGMIEESSTKISKITGVIEEIAFQTNLLALNAGVEAARAGEAGRGFAVVATEVRALAQRSSDAAREINELISVSNDQVGRGVGLVENAGKALEEIVGSVYEISSKVSNIAESSQRQSEGLAEINTSVGRLDQVTQQNAAMFEETSAASHTLDGEAKALISNIGRFNTNEKAQSARPAQARSDAIPTGFSTDEEENVRQSA